MSSTCHSALSSDGQPIPIRWVEDLFERLRAILGPRMADVLGTDVERVKAEWAEALASFSADEVKRGLAATRTRKFAPNLPEFLHLCRPSLDPEVAWIEAERGMSAHHSGVLVAWSHPAVYWAARDFVLELRSGSFAHHRKRWEQAMARQWADGVWCAPPDPRQRSLEHVQQPSDGAHTAPQEAKQRMREIRERLQCLATQAERGSS